MCYNFFSSVETVTALVTIYALTKQGRRMWILGQYLTISNASPLTVSHTSFLPEFPKTNL
ncbi:hypothetical protein KsCSTR_23560 [Candidatus Kuenenia stuttgartiensis]|uniref:Uncharacterized protein n=1 Tax=Kuenenia stuttgartiensis TaxID=174633 RepID=Q1Q3N0_KUEST|nr:hypothetical protein KsCSTR_23560 [Candidatus Kuenenia stuttgartiensis]CAJ74626.1 unknown protein [Candidatus Kuenenia stuttgartiensis]